MNAPPLVGQKTRDRGVPVLPILLALDTFVLGGLAAFLTVNRLLDALLGVYAPRDKDRIVDEPN